MDRSVFDNMARIDEDHWWFRARRRIIDTLIRRHAAPPAGGRLLEVGCGTGSNLALLSRFGVVEALEPDGEARDLAALRSGVEVREGVVPGAALPDGRYDLVALFDVLEHIGDDAGALRAIAPALAPGGKLLLTVPALPWLWGAHDVAHHHHRRYTAATLRRVLEANGFRLVHLSYFNTFLFPLIAGIRALGRVTGREANDDSMPAAPLNAALEAVFAAERHLVGRLCLPFGVSLAAIAEPVPAASLRKAA